MLAVYRKNTLRRTPYFYIIYITENSVKTMTLPKLLAIPTQSINDVTHSFQRKKCVSIF